MGVDRPDRTCEEYDNFIEGSTPIHHCSVMLRVDLRKDTQFHEDFTRIHSSIYVRSGRNSTPMKFPYNRGWENQPNSRGLYTHYKDSY